MSRPVWISKRFVLSLVLLGIAVGQFEWIAGASAAEESDDFKALHGAPRGPMKPPEPNPPQGKPDEAFFRKLVQSRAEMNLGGRTVLIEISTFEVRGQREAGVSETEPYQSHATVTPILVKWKQTSYGQTDDVSETHEQMWICWRNEGGLWLEGQTGQSTDGGMKTTNHDSR